MIRDYIKQIRQEVANAEEVIEVVRQTLTKDKKEFRNLYLTRKQTAELLQISMDTLRNWEMNGLLIVKRKENGYRIYTDKDIQQLTIIRSLRCANYSLSAILRMLNRLSADPTMNIQEVINTPGIDDDIVSACDKLLTSLSCAEQNAYEMLKQLVQMKTINPPL